MNETIKICETFESIQGEGKYAGNAMLFIRTSGCTRKCTFCDTQYHNSGKQTPIEDIIKMIKKSKLDFVCWTGGEPLLFKDEILKIIRNTNLKKHHIETNTELFPKSKEILDYFHYIGASPKEMRFAKIAKKILKHEVLSDGYDIKIVTDLEKEGVDMLKYATMLMPLTTYNKKKDLKIQRKVWEYAVKHNLKFTSRFQMWVWGKKKAI